MCGYTAAVGRCTAATHCIDTKEASPSPNEIYNPDLPNPEEMQNMWNITVPQIEKKTKKNRSLQQSPPISSLFFRKFSKTNFKCQGIVNHHIEIVVYDLQTKYTSTGYDTFK